MGEIYIMSDLHGEYDLMLKMIDKIKPSTEDQIIILGDVVDRGDKPIELLEYIMNNNIGMVLGNHERMFLDYLNANNKYEKRIIEEMWRKNGGHTTIAGYEKLPTNRQEDIVKYLKNLTLYKIIDKYILVHSGLNMSGLIMNLPIEAIMAAQNEDDLLWSREEFYSFRGIKDYTIIFGHTVTCNLNELTIENKRNFSIWYDTFYNDKIGIDCGATFGKFGGRLACLRLSDKKEYYVD